MTQATPAQINEIVRLANKISGTRAQHLSQVAGVIGISNGTAKRGLGKAEASTILDQLTDRAAANETPTVITGPPSAAQAVALLGQVVTVTTTYDRTGTVEAVVVSDKDGSPALSVRQADGTVFVPRLSVIVRISR